MFAKVIIEYPVKSLDKTFTYIIPNKLKNKVQVGMKVLVPFSKKLINGFVLEITDKDNSDFELKEIDSIVDEELILSDELLKLGEHMHNTILCTLISAYQTMLPSAFKAKKQKTNYDVYQKYIMLNKDEKEINEFITENSKCKKQIEILERLLKEQRIAKKEVTGVSLKSLLEKKLVKEVAEQKYRLNIDAKIKNNVKMTSDQEKVYKEVTSNMNEHQTYLLYGVTGSGKTEVYLNIIEKALKNNKTAIMLVPEISLTMQIVRRFYERFGSKVAVLHSALSDGEKHDEYLKIIRGEVSIVVGTRSAIFAPLKNLGVIIIDEEHSESYKQDNTPKYHARDIALFRTIYNNVPLVLGSATPSLETMARAKKDVYKLLELDKRIGNSVLPNVTLVNMEGEYKKKNFIFSEVLKNKINERIDNNEQVILLLNRRGFSTFISCSNCGYTYKCPNCDISLTYHKSSNNLICHYCGYQTKCPKECPNCNEDGLKYIGMGTEKLEEELKQVFPKANVIRMDQDTTTKKGSHDKIIELFRENKYNILLGTSMISKGLDFPNVTLVGVLSADTSLNIPDFRSNENTFSLLSQVAGRAGRRSKIGEVIIQTFNPDNKVLNCVKNNSYLEFYNYEMNFRRKLKYPPYYYLIGIKVSSSKYDVALEEAKKAVSFLKKHVSKETICLGPTTASILRFNNQYRFQIIIKYRFDNDLFASLRELDALFVATSKASIDIDVNPTRI